MNSVMFDKRGITLASTGIPLSDLTGSSVNTESWGECDRESILMIDRFNRMGTPQK